MDKNTIRKLNKDGTISIDNVTGNIVITATATPSQQ